MEDVDWSFYLLKSCYLIHKIGRIIAEEPKNVNLLTGLNGMGKSSVIQALLLLRQSYMANGLRNGLELTGYYTELGQGRDVLYEKAGENDDIEFGIWENGEEYSYAFKYDAETTLLPIGQLSEKFAPVITTDDFVYLSAYRIEPLKFYQIANRQNIDRRMFGNDGEFSLQFLKEHGPDKVINKAFGEDQDLNQLVQKYLKIISPGANASVDIHRMLNLSELRFEFTEGKEKTNPYRCVNVGFGLTYVLPVIIALVSAKPGDVITLENPEAHIHPAGQRKLGELIGKVGQSGVQVIVETHSDHIMNGLRIAVRRGELDVDKTNFAYFYKDSEDDYKHKCIFPQINEQGKFDYWPEGFFDEWDNSLMDLL